MSISTGHSCFVHGSQQAQGKPWREVEMAVGANEGSSEFYLSSYFQKSYRRSSVNYFMWHFKIQTEQCGGRKRKEREVCLTFLHSTVKDKMREKCRTTRCLLLPFTFIILHTHDVTDVNDCKNSRN